MKQIIEKYLKLLSEYEDCIRYGISINDGKPGQPAECAELEEISKTVRKCRKCGLSNTRTNAVPGMGAGNPLVFVIGEGPGADEDRQGLPFVGAAGKYLDKWLDAIGLSRDSNCFIGNVVKCRPPGNRDPLPEETDACIGYLKQQICILKPKAILTVGRISSSIITGENSGIGRIRGRVYSYAGIPVVATYHPSAVLRDQSYRKPVWEDLRLLRSIVDKNGR